MKAKAGDTIEIVEMKGEPQYAGRRGKVELIDAIGQLHGTWGGCAVIPEEDEFRIIRECCICGKEIKGYGNNPSPIEGDLCCDECNLKVVLNYRLFLSELERGSTAMLIEEDGIHLMVARNYAWFTKGEVDAMVGESPAWKASPFKDCIMAIQGEGAENRIAASLGIRGKGSILVMPLRMLGKGVMSPKNR